ncbi:MAG: hypothetical protein QXG36_09095 [Nitrososphaeria archaeon]
MTSKDVVSIFTSLRIGRQLGTWILFFPKEMVVARSAGRVVYIKVGKDWMDLMKILYNEDYEYVMEGNDFIMYRAIKNEDRQT